MISIRERRSEREEEVQGKWHTEERMEKDLGYSKILGGHDLHYNL